MQRIFLTQKLTIMPTIQTKRQLAKLLTTIFLFFSLSILFSCKKSVLEEPPEVVSSVANATTTNGCETTICEDCSFQEMIEEDTTEHATVLGGVYSNPYSIANMTLAYNNVNGTNIQSVTTTHYYVRFKPQTEAQLKILDSLDLELYDHPLDRVVIQDGDYWPEAYANLAPNEYPWFYTVVESNFQFPPGITYQNLAPLNIPNDNAALEDEAFNLTGNNECGGGTIPVASSPTGGTQNSAGNNTSAGRYEECPEGYYWNPVLGQCVPDNPPPFLPPTYLYPKGMISFHTYDDYGVIPYNAPLKYTRIVARRFFKIDKTYTDASGNFQLSKRFPNKVTIIVKFKTSNVIVKKSQMFGPQKKNIGTYRGNDLRNLNYVFIRKPSSALDASKSNRTKRWVSAVAINTFLETKNFLSSNNLIPLRNNFYIVLAGSSIDQQTPTYEFIRKSYLNFETDVVLQFHTDDVYSMATSRVTINMAQQLGLQYLFKVNDASPDGINRFYDYYNSLTYLGNYNYAYGYFGGSQNHMIAMWQAFAQHFGHTIATQVFGFGEYHFLLQANTWFSSGGITSSSKYLEQFDPNVAFSNDPLKWIPVGLINDLMDTNNETFPVIDNVSGFTYAEIQAAYFTQPSTMLELKNAFKSIKPTQATAIDQLFTSYNF